MIVTTIITAIFKSNLLISSGFVEASTSMSEGSDETDTGICLKEEIKQEIEAIRKRLEELSAKAERCQGRLRKRDKFKLEGGGGWGGERGRQLPLLMSLFGVTCLLQ